MKDVCPFLVCLTFVVQEDVCAFMWVWQQKPFFYSEMNVYSWRTQVSCRNSNPPVHIEDHDTIDLHFFAVIGAYSNLARGNSLTYYYTHASEELIKSFVYPNIKNNIQWFKETQSVLQRRLHSYNPVSRYWSCGILFPSGKQQTDESLKPN